MAGLLAGIRRLNGMGSHALAEPFAGGAGASLTLLFQEEASTILINDADSAVADFWWSLLNRAPSFLKLLDEAQLDITEWKRQRDIYRCQRKVARVTKGFATFYLNRCNRSGIIMNGGPIGGIDQNGAWKLDARFNKADLRRRCERVGSYGERISLTSLDGLAFLDQIDISTTFLFIDPPYFEKGPLLYLNALEEPYHLALAERLQRMPKAAWVLTYDDCPEIRAMYEGWATVRPFSLRYAAADRKSGREVLICPRWMRLPEGQDSAALVW